LILRKIIKIVATRCQIFSLKCTKFDFVWGSAPDPQAPLGELTALPQTSYLDFGGPTSKEREGAGRGKSEGKVEENRVGEEMKGAGKGLRPQRFTEMTPLDRSHREYLIQTYTILVLVLY